MFLSRRFNSGQAKLDRICSITGKANKLNALHIRYPDLDLNKADESGLCPLHRCCLHGFADCVRVLFNLGVNMMAACGEDKLRAIHVAALTGSIPVVSVLIDVNPHCLMDLTSSGYTLLHLASIRGNLELIKYLIELPTATHLNLFKLRDFAGNTPLILAVSSGHVSVADTMLDSKLVDVDAQDNLGITALHRAVSNEQPRMVKLLVRHKCTLTLMDHHGRVPTDLCSGSAIGAKIRNILWVASKLTASGENFPPKAEGKQNSTDTTNSELTAVPTSGDANVDGDATLPSEDSTSSVVEKHALKSTKSAQNVHFASLYDSEDVFESPENLRTKSDLSTLSTTVKPPPPIPRNSVTSAVHDLGYHMHGTNLLSRPGRGGGRRPSVGNGAVHSDSVSVDEGTVGASSDAVESVVSVSDVTSQPEQPSSVPSGAGGVIDSANVETNVIASSPVVVATKAPDSDRQLPAAPPVPPSPSRSKVPPPVPLRRPPTKKDLVTPASAVSPIDTSLTAESVASFPVTPSSSNSNNRIAPGKNPPPVPLRRAPPKEEISPATPSAATANSTNVGRGGDPPSAVVADRVIGMPLPAPQISPRKAPPPVPIRRASSRVLTNRSNENIVNAADEQLHSTPTGENLVSTTGKAILARANAKSAQAEEEDKEFLILNVEIAAVASTSPVQSARQYSPRKPEPNLSTSLTSHSSVPNGQAARKSGVVSNEDFDDEADSGAADFFSSPLKGGHYSHDFEETKQLDYSFQDS